MLSWGGRLTRLLAIKCGLQWMGLNRNRFKWGSDCKRTQGDFLDCLINHESWTQYFIFFLQKIYGRHNIKVGAYL